MKILLVDDETQVLDALRALLEAAGAGEVRTAGCGEEALRVAREWGGPDVLVTDVVMEPMDGFTLRETLAAEYPALRAVFVSAYDLTEHAGRLAGAQVLAKPATAEEILAAAAADPAIGTTIGPFYLQEAAGKHGAVTDYLAWQQNVGRHVVVHVLDAAAAHDPAAAEHFLADARAKAAVTHPYLLAVHEAGEAGGKYFFSSDFLPGHALPAYAAAGHKLDDRVVLSALRTAAEVSDYFKTHGLARRRLEPSDVMLDASLRPRLANVAVGSGTTAPAEAEEVADLARCLQEVADPAGAVYPALAMLSGGQSDWGAAWQLAAAAKPASAPKDATKLGERAAAARQIVAQTKAQQKKRLIITSAMSFLLLVSGIFFLLRFLGGSERSVTTRMIEIPAGEFVYQDGEKVTLPAFWIDEHEVTIADYKEFLDFLEANPGEAAKLAHPDMPEGKSHVPLDWADDKEINTWGFYRGATKGSWKRNFPLSVDHPVFNVDWFDAYSYAKWKGRRLPTEQEWEKAARGTDGRKFPWGNNEDPARANTGADLKPNPKEGGEIDGNRRWARVDDPDGDRSPFGVRGMAGNVSEWTATYAPSEDGMGDVPVVRGGNWGNPEHVVTRRRAILDPMKFQDTLGFRTVSDTPPK